MYKYFNGYYLCQRVNSVTQESVGTLKPLMIQVGPLTDISYNLIPGLPLSNRFDSILTAIEWLKKMVHFIPYKETGKPDIETHMELYGAKNTVYERRSVFNLLVRKEPDKHLSSQIHPSSAKHSETDRQ